MKASEVINHIFSLREFYALSVINKTTKALKVVLGKSKEGLVRYAYIRNDCLYIAVCAPFAAQELKHDSIINSIKYSLNMYLKAQNNEFYEIKNVKIFVAKHKEPKNSAQNQPLNLEEKASGYFKIHCSKPELSGIFEKIQKILKERV